MALTYRWMFLRSASAWHSVIRFTVSRCSWLVLPAGLLVQQSACNVYSSSLLGVDQANVGAGAGNDAGGDSSTTTGGDAGALSGGVGGQPSAAGAAGKGGEAGSTAGQGGGSGIGGTGSAGGAGGSSGAAGGGGSAGVTGAAGNAGAGGNAGGGGSSAGSGGMGGLNACDRTHWVATASSSSSSTTTPSLNTPPSQAIDGNGATRWSNGATQVGGEWFRVDLGGSAHLTQVVLDTTNHATDFPAAYKLEMSGDGSAYTQVATGSGSALTTITFSDHVARYVRITQTGTSDSWWSIRELSISCQSN